MSARKKSRKSIKNKILMVVIPPILILSVLIISIGMILLYKSYVQSIQDELSSTTNILMDCLELTVRGDYSFEDDMLIKGDLNITDSTMLYRVKEKSQIDTTIFWKDTRILTTVEDKYGISAVGTKANADVIDAVLGKGDTYFSDDLDVNGVAYVGYYAPLENSGHTVVGMVFAGKQRSLVYKKAFSILLWFVIFSVFALVTATLLTRLFSNQLIFDINMINRFLRTISEGDLSATLDERIVIRKDEIGTIGLYASKMRADLKKMIEMDPLTSLFNRRSCNNKLNAMEKDGDEFSIVMCDIDWFKKINDSYGHDAGDYVLVTISSLISENVGECGFASRWGGEEFLLIYTLDSAMTKEKVEQLQKNIREYDFQYEEQKIKITMTFGIEAEESDKPYEERIKMADSKLYIGKNNGRNQIVC